MICISGGHNQRNKGATYEGFSEFPETLIWAEQIVRKLKSFKLRAHCVSENTLIQKVEEINKKSPVLAVEIHFNADPKHKGRGCETLYYPHSHKGLYLANEIQRQISSFFPPNRGVKAGWYQMDVPGVVDYVGDIDGDESIDFFLRATHCPAVIIEPEFIHNRSVIEIGRDVGCQVIAEALRDVVIEWRI